MPILSLVGNCAATSQPVPLAFWNQTFIGVSGGGLWRMSATHADAVPTCIVAIAQEEA